MPREYEDKVDPTEPWPSAPSIPTEEEHQGDAPHSQPPKPASADQEQTMQIPS